MHFKFAAIANGIAIGYVNLISVTDPKTMLFRLSVFCFKHHAVNLQNVVELQSFALCYRNDYSIYLRSKMCSSSSHSSSSCPGWPVVYWTLTVNRITHLTTIETGLLSIICMCCSAHVEFVLKNLIVLYSYVW